MMSAQLVEDHKSEIVKKKKKNLFGVRQKRTKLCIHGCRGGEPQVKTDPLSNPKCLKGKLSSPQLTCRLTLTWPIVIPKHRYLSSLSALLVQLTAQQAILFV